MQFLSTAQRLISVNWPDRLTKGHNLHSKVMNDKSVKNEHISEINMSAVMRLVFVFLCQQQIEHGKCGLIVV